MAIVKKALCSQMQIEEFASKATFNYVRINNPATTSILNEYICTCACSLLKEYFPNAQAIDDVTDFQNISGRNICSLICYSKVVDYKIIYGLLIAIFDQIEEKWMVFNKKNMKFNTPFNCRKKFLIIFKDPFNNYKRSCVVINRTETNQVLTNYFVL